ncbi:hypothetical protein MMC20_001781 [Loxospora ochrophaea]|nr:hypothetical protein [Loxospora ochrophaea]
MALALKEEGNKKFKAGDYKGAEELYTRAIQKDPWNSTLFTNRAFSRIKLQSWDPCIDDCIRSIEIDNDSMKGYFYLAQAQLELKHPNEALSSALTAYHLCLKANNPSASSISELVLKAKKQKWEAKERDRLRRRSNLLRELEDKLEESAELERLNLQTLTKEGELSKSQGFEEKLEVEHSLAQKLEELRNTFAIADPEHMARREVPDYLIDSVSFSIMHDPVVTKNGHSYSRTTIYEHLRRSETDPLTREPLRREDLRPNLALKQACAEFLEQNGWAVDW